LNEQRTNARHARGFSLLEVLVALCILVLCLGMIMSMYSTALQHASDAAAITRATRAGETLLAQLGAEIPLRKGISSGQLGDGYHWQITISEYQPEGAPQNWQMSLHAYWVDIDIHWEGPDRPRSVNFTTLRLTTDQQTAL